MPGPILIAGGGIGGLTAGIALRRAGFEVRVFERAAEIREVGAGLTVQSNAILALRRIGLDRAVIESGRVLGAGNVRRPDGTDRFVSADNPPRFPPITAGEFLDQRLREIGLKK